MIDSIHTARWISQISSQGWDISIFPSIDTGSPIHPLLKGATVYYSFYGRQKDVGKGIKTMGVYLFFEPVAYLGRWFLQKLIPSYQALYLALVIWLTKPDVVHSIEIQHAGYLTFRARKILGGKFPKWVVTNLGSDLYLFSRLDYHVKRIEEVVQSADYYKCESKRDVALGKEFGFEGKVWPVYPNGGGFNLKEIAKLKQPGRVSDRRLIMLKGYQDWAGRALVGLRALERCADLLRGYKLVIYSAKKDVEIAANLFSKSVGIPVQVLPQKTLNREILWCHGHARISLGTSVSDGISTSLLEAMAMGSFPIQSWTSTADEWIKNGRTGILVPPEDPEIIEQAIRKALTNNDLVNRSAKLNWGVVAERLDFRKLKSQTVKYYKSILA